MARHWEGPIPPNRSLLLDRIDAILQRPILHPDTQALLRDIRATLRMGEARDNPNQQSHAFRLLEQEIDRLTKRQDDLLGANNQYLERARAAERQYRELRDMVRYFFEGFSKVSID